MRNRSGRDVPIAAIFQCALHNAGKVVAILVVTIDWGRQRHSWCDEALSSGKQSSQNQHFYHCCSLHCNTSCPYFSLRAARLFTQLEKSQFSLTSLRETGPRHRLSLAKF